MKRQIQRVCVVGLGKLGSPLAATLAAKGLDVVGVDLDPHKVDAINAGRPPVNEPGLVELLQQAGGRLRATQDLEAASAASELTFVIVPTPSGHDGRFDSSFVLEAVNRIGRGIRRQSNRHTVSITSTVMPGQTGGPIREALEAAAGRSIGPDLGLCYSPEFIALGTVVRDLTHPDMLLVGESDDVAGDDLLSALQRVVESDPVVRRMGFADAELTKLALNSFITTKITFANTLAAIAESVPGADADVVAEALGLDQRVSGKCLRGGLGFGGPCFPRDNRAFAEVASAQDTPAKVDARLLDAVDQVNLNIPSRIADLAAGGEKAGRVAISGVSYKPGTGVIEGSQGVMIARELLSRGWQVLLHDPNHEALFSARAVLGDGVSLIEELEDLDVCDAVVLGMPWPGCGEAMQAALASVRRPIRVVDCWRLLEDRQLPERVSLITLGKGSADQRSEESIPSSSLASAA